MSILPRALYSRCHLISVALILVALLIPGGAVAGDDVADFQTLNLTGTQGVITTPDARMDDTGTLHIGTATSDPYLHGYMGVQLDEALYLKVRQTGEVSSLRDDADRLYPGIDLKLGLLDETRLRPELALGLDAAIGHKRMAGEYLVASKRLGPFDLSSGIAWGRLGSAGTIANPLGIFGGHFDQTRSLGGPDSGAPGDWFTGRRAGLFAGVTYYTPFKGLELSLEYGADDYVRETARIPGFEAPGRWAVGVNYRPHKNYQTGLAVIGGDKVMAHLNFNRHMAAFEGDKADKDDLIPDLISSPPFEINAAKIAERISFDIKNGIARVRLHLRPRMSTPAQLRQVAKTFLKRTPDTVTSLIVNIYRHGLRGPVVKLPRRAVAQALRHEPGRSIEELWHSAQISNNAKAQRNAPRENGLQYPEFKLAIDQDIALTSEDATIWHRAGFIAAAEQYIGRGFAHAHGLRLPIADNLQGQRFTRLRMNRLRGREPVRSDVALYAGDGPGLEFSKLQLTRTLGDNLHAGLAAGYLEEMYAGAGGALLWRPWGKSYALGARLHHVYKRDPFSTLDLKLIEDSDVTTGFVDAYYAPARSDLTFKASAGRFLGEDWGAKFAISRRFDNGVRLAGFVTVSERAERDLFGGTSHSKAGLRLNVPLGTVPLTNVPVISAIDVAPIGRDTGQMLEGGASLYEMSEGLSLRHIGRRWQAFDKE